MAVLGFEDDGDGYGGYKPPTGGVTGYGGGYTGGISYAPPTAGPKPPPSTSGSRPSPTPPTPPAPPTAPAPPTTPAPPASSYKFDFGTFKQRFNELIQGRSGTLEDFNTYLFPMLQKEFPDIVKFGSKGDKIRLPNGGVVDAVISAGLGGRGYNFGYSEGPSTFFDDPLGSWYGSTIEGIMAQLGQGPRPTDPHVLEVYNLLKGLMSGGGGADLGAFEQAVNKRYAELNAPVYSDSEEAARRVGAFDNLERSRQVAIQQTVERLAQRGFAPSSGTTESAIQQINASFDSLRAQNENKLFLEATSEGQRRKSESVSIQQSLAALKEQAAEAAAQKQISAGSALAQLAQFIGQQQDPLSYLALLLQAAGKIPDYAHQVTVDAQNSLG